VRLVLLALALVACDTVKVELYPDLASVPDLAATDLASSCVCRLLRCRTSTDCQAAIGPSSRCDTSTFVCSDAAGACQTSADCPATSGWSCVTSPTSETMCPSR